ncbi:28S ribosomal protein S11, mitochondrial, partial [Coemansia asiatica]
MFNRLAPLTLRLAGRHSTQRLCSAKPASLAIASKQQRTYTSDGKDIDETKRAEDADKAKEKSSLDALINSLKVKEGENSRAPVIPLLGRYQDLLGGSSGLKGDNAGFMGTGRFGGTADRGLADDDLSDPMSKLILHVHASSNNTILSLTDAVGKVLINASGGTVGFRKAQRAGFEAAYQATA